MIRRFQIDGILKEGANLIKAREDFERFLETDMRGQGYVPLFDVAPAWSTSWRNEQECYEFLLTMQGVWVGREKSWTIEGISDGKPLPKPTPTPKSTQS